MLTIIDGPPRLIEADTLNEIGRDVASRRQQEICSRVLGDRLWRLEGLETTRRDGQARFRVGRVLGSLGGEFFEVVGLETALASEQDEVWLALDESWEPVGGVPESGVAWRVLRATLVPPTANRPALPLARIRRLPGDAGLTQVDESWWPDPPRIDADPRSRAALERIRSLIPSPGPELTYLLARAEALPWWALLPEVFRHLRERFSSDAERLDRLSQAATARRDCQVATRLAELLVVEPRPALPDELELGRWRLLRALETVTETRSRRGGAWVHQHVFRAPGPLPAPAPPDGRGAGRPARWPAPGAPGLGGGGRGDARLDEPADFPAGVGLFLVLSKGSEVGVRKVVVSAGKDPAEAYLALGDVPQFFGYVKRAEPLEVEVDDAVVDAAGLYLERVG